MSGRGGGLRRSWSRRLAMQALYQWQLAGHDTALIEEQFRDREELARSDEEFFCELLHQSVFRAAEIDRALEPWLDRPLAQLDPVEHAILLLGGYELLHRPDIPYRVVINEAVELAKRFGAEQGHRFVNGVLDKAAHACRADPSEASA